MIDDEKVAGTFVGHKFQTELLLNRGEDFRCRRLGRCKPASHHAVANRFARREFEMDFIFSIEPGFVHDAW